MSRKPTPLTKLSELHSDLTARLLLDAALRVLDHSSVGELTFRAVAAEAHISERTVFRYFPTRDEFLDAIAEAVTHRLVLPPPPGTLEELRGAPKALYSCFEAERSLTKAAVHSEFHDRMRARAKPRWNAVRKLIDSSAPRRTERRRKLAAATIQYLLSANAWHSCRFHFDLTLDESIECAETAIAQTIHSLQAPQTDTRKQ
jgi:AcrR family transcriptional regulator